MYGDVESILRPIFLVCCLGGCIIFGWFVAVPYVENAINPPPAYHWSVSNATVAHPSLHDCTNSTRHFIWNQTYTICSR